MTQIYEIEWVDGEFTSIEGKTFYEAFKSQYAPNMYNFVKNFKELDYKHRFMTDKGKIIVKEDAEFIDSVS